MASERAEKVAEELERTINNFGCREDMEHITGAMLNMHRTLNQSFMNHLIIPFVQEMARRYSSGRFDARNEVWGKRMAPIRMWWCGILTRLRNCLPLRPSSPRRG